jgi:UDP-N-acetylglucosamine--N-acetylmuramyl-(pentapeptide) pyrophosphoryl-undecaprenol N-acetylglucosamine transferase
MSSSLSGSRAEREFREKKMKICLAANSGGHLNQLLQLKPLYNKHDHFFITDKNSFSEELAATENIYFVEKFVIKEVFQKYQFLRPVKNIFQSFLAIIRERPDVIITSGAGVALGALLICKMMFIRTIFIESIARTHEPSTFGRVIGKRSDLVLVQWKPLLEYYRNAVHAGLIFNFKDIKCSSTKIKKIFITVGTYHLQFDRIFKEMDSLIKSRAVGSEVIAQIGASTYIPRNYEYFDYCGQTRLHELVGQSDLIICQGGSGSIMDSLMRGKKVISIPRLREFNEFFDDHQLQIVGELERLKLIIAVYDISKLGDAIKRSASFIPDFNSMRQLGIASYLEDYLKKHDMV